MQHFWLVGHACVVDNKIVSQSESTQSITMSKPQALINVESRLRGMGARRQADHVGVLAMHKNGSVVDNHLLHPNYCGADSSIRNPTYRGCCITHHAHIVCKLMMSLVIYISRDIVRNGLSIDD